MTPRIQKAIDVFLDAINEGTLTKGTCIACAVGNLVAHGKGMKIIKGRDDSYVCVPHIPKEDNTSWKFAFMTTYGSQTRDRNYDNDPSVLSCVNATDFTLNELAAIEFAFETNTEIDDFSYWKRTPKEIRADQIKGLEAVVKVMLEFDEQPSTDLDIKEVFTNKAELIPIQ